MGRDLQSFTTFCQLMGLKLKDPDTGKGTALIFLGVFGEFTGPRSDISLTVSLPREKAIRRGRKIQEFIAKWTVMRKE